MALHILPLNDTYEHIESTTCKCNPLVEFYSGEIIVTHNSFDKREQVEKLRCDALKNTN